MINDHAQAWLNLHCQMISGVRMAVLMLGPTTDGALTPTAYWPNRQSNVELLVITGKLALQKRKAVLQNYQSNPKSNEASLALCNCAYPLTHQGRIIGTLVIQVDKPDQRKLRAVQKTLDSSSNWLQLSLSKNEATAIAARFATVLEITAKSLQRATLQESATSVITHLTQAFACDRVSFGHLVNKREIHVMAISHNAQIDRRTESIQHIEAAMEESLDEGNSVTIPALKPGSRWPAHMQLCAHHNNDTVCTLLLNNNGTATGALTFERHNGCAFDQQTIDVLEAITAMIGPIFEMKRRQDLPLLSKLKISGATALGGLVGRSHLKTKLATIATLAVCFFLSVVPSTFRVNAGATLEGTEHRALVAAIDGFVDEAHLRAGERVHKGDLIATLDTSSLEMKLRQLISEKNNLVKKHDRAIGGLERAEATIIQAQIGKANAQLNLVEEQIKRTRIVAPIDGIIVSGDLSHTLGAPVEKGQMLFEIAPLDSYRMALQVNEADIAHVQPGQEGFLALSASPSDRLSFVVEDIIGVALTNEGQNGFRVEARLESSTTQLRPGMLGVGKIEISKRSLLWIWGHTLFDRISLWLWSSLP